jgi:hypothetical protein
MSAPTLWQEGHWTGERVIRLAIFLTLLTAATDVAVTGHLGRIFDVAFVLVCIGAALVVRPGDFFGIGVLPPLLLLGCASVLSLVARTTVASRGDGIIQGVVSALAGHSGALAAGYLLCLAILAIRQRVLARERTHAKRVGSPAP